MSEVLDICLSDRLQVPEHENGVIVFQNWITACTGVYRWFSGFGRVLEIAFVFFHAACGEERRRRALGALWFHLCAVGLTRPRGRKGD